MSKAANAVLALSRAFYGKRLSEKQYTDLLSCASLNEIASYLRSRTVYGEAFEGVQVSDFTSKTLEDIINKYKFGKFDALCRYELAIGSEFYKYFIVKTEVEQILNCTLLMIGGNTEGYLMQMTNFLNRHLGIDLYALGKANSLEEIAAALGNTPYEKIFRRCLSNPERSYLSFEIAFDGYFERFQQQLIERCFKGDEKKAMREMISRNFDRTFIQKQFRTVKYYGGNLAVTNLLTLPDVSLTLLTERQIKQIASAKDEVELVRVIEATPYRDCVSRGSDGIEKKLFEGFYSYCKKAVRFSSHPGVVMYAYLFLVQTEIMNLVRIIEGVKYKIPQEDIKNSIVGVGD